MFELRRIIEIELGDRFVLRKDVCIVREIDEDGGVVYLLAQEVDNPALEIVTTGFLPYRFWWNKDWIYRDGYYRIIVLERAMKAKVRQKRPPFKLGLPRRELSGRFYQAQVDFEWTAPEPNEIDEDFKRYEPQMLPFVPENKETEQQTLEDYENDYKIRHLDW